MGPWGPAGPGLRILPQAAPTKPEKSLQLARGRGDLGDRFAKPIVGSLLPFILPDRCQNRTGMNHSEEKSLSPASRWETVSRVFPALGKRSGAPVVKDVARGREGEALMLGTVRQTKPKPPRRCLCSETFQRRGPLSGLASPGVPRAQGESAPSASLTPESFPSVSHPDLSLGVSNLGSAVENVFFLWPPPWALC